jgi:soluble lytic murein transglycosylase-like protein
MTFPTLVRRAVGAALITAAVSFSAHPVAAQKTHAASGDHDMQTLANYRLSEAALRKYYAAMTNVMKAAAKDTASVQALDDDNSHGDEDLAGMAAKYDRIPVLKSALTAAGLTSTEFATFTMSYMQATMANSLMTQGPEAMRIKELPKGTPKENVDFVRTHQELIQKLDKELKALQGGGEG